MLVRSKLTNELYDDDKVVYFRNPAQSARYCYNGCPLIDLIPTEHDRFIFVFNRADHEEYKHLWIRKDKEDK